MQSRFTIILFENVNSAFNTFFNFQLLPIFLNEDIIPLLTAKKKKHFQQNKLALL